MSGHEGTAVMGADSPSSAAIHEKKPAALQEKDQVSGQA